MVRSNQLTLRRYLMGKNTQKRGLARQARREERREARHNKTSLHVVENDGFDIDVRKPSRSSISPRNAKQAQYIEALHNKDLVISNGPAGCGKTFIATAYAADRLVNKDFDKIIITRPVLGNDDLGYLPGDMVEKFMPFFRPVYDVLVERLGASFVQHAMKPGIEKIEILPFAFMRGRSLKNALIILDEAQNTTIKQMKTFITRTGEDSQIIINGDIEQCDLCSGETSGLTDLISRSYDYQNHLMEVVEFEECDSTRSAICSLALRMYRD